MMEKRVQELDDRSWQGVPQMSKACGCAILQGLCIDDSNCRLPKIEQAVREMLADLMNPAKHRWQGQPDAAREAQLNRVLKLFEEE